jgi:hypothetical protein
LSLAFVGVSLRPIFPKTTKLGVVKRLDSQSKPLLTSTRHPAEIQKKLRAGFLNTAEQSFGENPNFVLLLNR